MEVLCGTAPQWLIKAFAKRGITLTAVGPCTALPGPERGHIDLMALALLGTIFVTPETSPLFSGYWKTAKVTIPEHLGPVYPEDVKLSSAQVGRHLLCREESLSNAVKAYALQKGLHILNVNQGYVRCSVCPCGDNAVITDDSSIAKVLRDHTAVDVLELSKGEIRLPGYSYGFIGGATGKIGDILYFFGSLEHLREAEKIRIFLRDHDVAFHSLSSERPLYDIGGIIPL